MPSTAESGLIYVVLRDEGAYSDRHRDVVGVSDSEDGARQLAEQHATDLERERHTLHVAWDADDVEDVGWTEDWQPAGPDQWGDVHPLRRHFHNTSSYDRGNYEITAHMPNIPTFVQE